MKKPKEVKVTELTNMARVIAEAMIKERGEYRCMIGGERVVVRK